MKFFAGNALWQLIKQSDAVSICVILILCVMSIFCWAIAIYKFHLLYKKIKQVDALVQHINTVHSLEQLLHVGQMFGTTISGIIIARALARAQFLLQGNSALQQRLSQYDIEIIRDEVDAALEELVVAEEQSLPFLKTCAEAGPLLGLFGTIWGLIHAFVRISQEQNADIVTVAPGIAEALITTLVGLIVAIPALILFNMLQTRVYYLEHQLGLIADRCMWILQSSLRAKEQ